MPMDDEFLYMDKVAVENMVHHCEHIATDAHNGQFRKYSGEPYIVHPRSVAALCSCPFDKCVAFLHDVLEDTSVSVVDLKSMGVPEKVIRAVTILSHTPSDTYLTYILNICASSDIGESVRRVKMADLKDNLKDVPEGSLKDKYLLAKHIIELKMMEQEE